jgi:hypothetical protein
MALGNLRTSSQAAKLLGTTQRYVVTLVERGKLTPADKLPGKTGAYLFAVDELERFRTARNGDAAEHAAGAAA